MFHVRSVGMPRFLISLGLVVFAVLTTLAMTETASARIASSNSPARFLAAPPLRIASARNRCSVSVGMALILSSYRPVAEFSRGRVFIRIPGR